LTSIGHIGWHHNGHKANPVSHLTGTWAGMPNAVFWVCIRMATAMFKITHKTAHEFSLAEILLMAAMNQVEAKRKIVENERGRCAKDQSGA
jgi:hypothetical protein